MQVLERFDDAGRVEARRRIVEIAAIPVKINVKNPMSLILIFYVTIWFKVRILVFLSQNYSKIFFFGKTNREGKVNEPEDGPQFATETGFHEHVEVLAILEGFVEFDDKVTVGLLHDVLLRHDVLLLSRFHNLASEKVTGQEVKSSVNWSFSYFSSFLVS